MQNAKSIPRRNIGFVEIGTPTSRTIGWRRIGRCKGTVAGAPPRRLRYDRVQRLIIKNPALEDLELHDCVSPTNEAFALNSQSFESESDSTVWTVYFSSLQSIYLPRMSER